MLDFVIDQPLSTWIDPEDILEVLAASFTGPNTAMTIERHLRPGWDRHVERCQDNGETLGNCVPDDVRQRIVRLITSTPPPRARWADDAIDPKLVRELLAPVIQDFLLGFARRLPIPGIGGREDEGASRSATGFGLRDRFKQSVEKRTERFVEAGKSVLGGLGAEVERQIQAAARDFSETAQRDLKDSLLKRLESPEGRSLLNRIATQVVDCALDTPLAEMNVDVEALPLDDIWALVPAIVEHNNGRDPIVDAIRDELVAVLEVDGERSLRELLTEAGTLDVTVAKALENAEAPARALFASRAFEDWVGALLEV